MARNAGPANKGLLKLAFRHPSSPDIDKRDVYETKKLPNGSLLKNASESISRVLSLDDHLSRTRVTARLKHATRMHGRAAVWHSYLRLLQMGFSSHVVANALVRSYRTVSAFLPLARGSLLFCGTFRRVAPPSR